MTRIKKVGGKEFRFDCVRSVFIVATTLVNQAKAEKKTRDLILVDAYSKSRRLSSYHAPDLRGIASGRIIYERRYLLSRKKSFLEELFLSLKRRVMNERVVNRWEKRKKNPVLVLPHTHKTFLARLKKDLLGGSSEKENSRNKKSACQLQRVNLPTSKADKRANFPIRRLFSRRPPWR